MPDWKETAASIDAWAAPRLKAGQAMQDAYFDEHGRYWQMLPLCDEPPADGETVKPDLDRCPADQPDSPRDVGAAGLFPSDLASQPRIDVCEGPDGHGWAITFAFAFEGVTYSETFGFEALASASHGWQPMPEVRP